VSQGSVHCAVHIMGSQRRHSYTMGAEHKGGGVRGGIHAQMGDLAASRADYGSLEVVFIISWCANPCAPRVVFMHNLRDI
jgi:hypothetical protein